MLRKGTKLHSILYFKCPQCQSDKLFHHKLYNLKKVGSMESTCSKCNLRYAKEPGFFYGAAYVSYGLTVAFGIAIYLLAFLLAPSLGWQFHLTSVIVGLILLFPVSFALSRSIWLNMFYKYKPQ